MQKKGGKSKYCHKGSTKKAGKSERCEAAAAASSVHTQSQPKPKSQSQLPDRGSFGIWWCAALGIPAALCVIFSLVLLVPSIA